ncbi:hypothetical protein [Sorangium cellulosum]|uniref:TolA protein n=1 Tax=Sorangium cellulosum TaxID=56 RepID=A0A150QNU1_SORCE|nr:hypothetical protein [Sorangium cellulosum]KYF69318.1 hypothetical protein BE15_18380 [Sorangium cellulosum]
MASRTKGTRGGGPPAAAVVDEDEVDDLYKKPLGDFTRARDDLAKRLRQAGDKAAAARVKALRRPTAAAWTLNQLARRYPQRMEALLDAGERLREAQQGALAPGGAQELREASQGHRAIVNELLRAAPALFAEGGYSEKGNPMDRLRDSLLATPTASASDLELLARGRVSGEIEPGDLSDMLGLLRGRPSERPAGADEEEKADRGRKTRKAEPPPKRREARKAPEKQRSATEERNRKDQRSAKERAQEDERSAKEREKQRSAKERSQEARRAAEEREKKARIEAGEREKKAQLAAERRARKERLAAEQREQKAQLAAAERERDRASREAGRAAREADRLTREAARMGRAAEKAEEVARAARKRADEAERKAAEAQQKAADSAGRLDAAEDRLDRLGR